MSGIVLLERGLQLGHEFLADLGALPLTPAHLLLLRLSGPQRLSTVRWLSPRAPAKVICAATVIVLLPRLPTVIPSSCVGCVLIVLFWLDFALVTVRSCVKDDARCGAYLGGDLPKHLGFRRGDLGDGCVSPNQLSSFRRHSSR